MKFNDLVKMMMHKPSSQRFMEIDMLRGLAISLMIFGHILWDLDHFGLAPMNSDIYSFLQTFVPQLFFILVGISLVISIKKMESSKPQTEGKFFKSLFVRGLKIFELGMILTIGSLIFMPESPVFFGVLHCIGISILLSAPFLKYRNYALPFALLFIFVGNMLAQYSFEAPTVLHLAIGLHPENVWALTVDYFPMLPWFGFTLLGVVIGDWLYCGTKRRFRIPDLSRCRPAKIFQWAGQHSLGIYLIHQPIIAGTLAALMIL